MKLSKIVMSVCVALSVGMVPIASANIAEELFDKYAANSPATVQNYQGKTFYGGRFAGRIDRNPIDLIGFQSPTVSAGCGGIDFFAGSFSIVSKDEIVQMLRGVAQGVPAYFFNLALSNVCSDCAELATELEKRVAELNQWGRMSCEDAGQALDQATGFSSWLDGKLKTEGPQREASNGLADGPLSFLTKSIPTPTSLAAEHGQDQSTVEAMVETPNYLAHLIGELGAIDYPYVPAAYGGSLYEYKKDVYLLMAALAGFEVVDVSTGDLVVDFESKTLSISTLFEGAEEAASILYFDCVAAAPSPILPTTNIDTECQSISRTDYNEGSSFFDTRIGWAKNFEDLMFDEVNAGNLGIVPRLRNKLQMSARQQQLINMTGFNFVSLAVEQDPILFDMMKDKVIAITKETMFNDFVRKTRALLNALERNAENKKEPFLWVQEVQILREEIEQGISEYRMFLANEKAKEGGKTAQYLAQATAVNGQQINLWRNK